MTDSTMGSAVRSQAEIAAELRATGLELQQVEDALTAAIDAKFDLTIRQESLQRQYERLKEELVRAVIHD